MPIRPAVIINPPGMNPQVIAPANSSAQLPTVTEGQRHGWKSDKKANFKQLEHAAKHSMLLS